MPNIFITRYYKIKLTYDDTVIYFKDDYAFKTIKLDFEDIASMANDQGLIEPYDLWQDIEFASEITAEEFNANQRRWQ